MNKGKKKKVNFSQIYAFDNSFCLMSYCFWDKELGDDLDHDPDHQGPKGKFWNPKGLNDLSESENDSTENNLINQSFVRNDWADLAGVKVEGKRLSKKRKSRLFKTDKKSFTPQLSLKTRAKLEGIYKRKIAALRQILYKCSKTEMISMVFALRNRLTNNSDPIQGMDKVFKVAPSTLPDNFMESDDDDLGPLYGLLEVEGHEHSNNNNGKGDLFPDLGADLGSVSGY